MSRNEPTTRTRILEMAIGLLEAGGGAEVRMADIARHAQVSRQAVYLHFGSRADLLIAATHHVDASLDLEARLKPSRTASSGIERVALYVEFWGRYVPLVHGVASALIAMRERDAAAAAAWDEREAALKDGCAGAVDQLIEDDSLAPCWERETAIALFWNQLSVANWERLTLECGWTQTQYVKRMQLLLNRTLVSAPFCA